MGTLEGGSRRTGCMYTYSSNINLSKLLESSEGQRSLACCSPGDHRVRGLSDWTIADFTFLVQQKPRQHCKATKPQVLKSVSEAPRQITLSCCVLRALDVTLFLKSFSWLDKSDDKHSLELSLTFFSSFPPLPFPALPFLIYLSLTILVLDFNSKILGTQLLLILLKWQHCFRGEDRGRKTGKNCWGTWDWLLTNACFKNEDNWIWFRELDSGWREIQGKMLQEKEVQLLIYFLIFLSIIHYEMFLKGKGYIYKP